MTSLTRKYRFSASHRLHSPDLSDGENARLYGKCNNPFGHGHDYVLEIGVAGPVHPLTGLIVPIPALDTFIERYILRLFANRNINLDVPQFSNGLIATSENIALVIADIIQRHWSDQFGSTAARLQRIHVQETDRNGFELLLGVAGPQVLSAAEMEGVTSHG
jgi:6-pyruvoyltetrahydropterin/6-carboxytetrahydropterin synthase